MFAARPALVLLALAGSLTSPVAGAAEAWPARPVRLVVPLFAGAATDIVARKLADALSPVLGQSVLVENKPGASTTLGANFVAKSAPDGYNLLVATTSTLSILPTVMKPPYDTATELAPVSAFALAPFVVLVSAESRHRTFADFVTTARANPGKVTFGSSGAGTATHMAVELIASVTKANLSHIPYKGVTGAYTDVLGGRIDMVADAPASSTPQVKAGKLRALAVTSARRSRLLPDVPTVAELGYADAESDFLTGLLAPGGTPRAIIDRLQAETLRLAQSAEFREFLSQQGYEPLALRADEFTARVRTETAKWAALVRERNIRIEQ